MFEIEGCLRKSDLRNREKIEVVDKGRYLR